MEDPEDRETMNITLGLVAILSEKNKKLIDLLELKEGMDRSNAAIEIPKTYNGLLADIAKTQGEIERLQHPDKDIKL